MEYSIFQNFAYFHCCTLFLEYSWNIPYSKIFDISVVAGFFWNIPYSKNPKKTLWREKIGIFHIPVLREKMLWYEKIGILHIQISEIKNLFYLHIGFLVLKQKSRILTLPPEFFVSIGENLPPTYYVILRRLIIFQVWIFTHAFRRLAYLIIVILYSFLHTCLKGMYYHYFCPTFSAPAAGLYFKWYCIKLFSGLRQAQYYCDTGLQLFLPESGLYYRGLNFLFCALSEIYSLIILA